MYKINIYDIVRDHLGTLRNNRTNKFSWGDALVFFGFPIIAAFGLIYFNKTLNADSRNIFGITLAVLIGLLFNVLLLIHTISGAFERQGARLTQYLKEIYYNIAFSVLVAIVSLISLMVTAFVAGDLAKGLSGFVFYLTAVLALTLLMVLKRLHVLFTEQLG